MNGGTATATALPSMSSEWSSSLGDFNGDGTTELFWNNTKTGENMIWFGDGSTAAVNTTPVAWYTA
jgi:hypothetical protein